MTKSENVKKSEQTVDPAQELDGDNPSERLKHGKMSKCMEAALEAVEKMGETNKQ